MPEVTAPVWRHVAGVTTHRSGSLAADAGIARDIPITRVARTIVDLAGRLEEQELASFVHRASGQHGVKAPHIQAVLHRLPNTPGTRVLRRVIWGDVQVVLSQLEAAFLELLRRHGLPLPLTNVSAGGRFVDCRWPEHQLTVELDSFAFHNSRASWEKDRRREREAYARGDQFRRYTWDDVHRYESALVRELRPLLLPSPSRF